MANPSVTYTFTNGTTADGTQVSQNFTDLINGLTDGTKSLNIDAITAAGTATFNGNTVLGNAAGDTIAMNGYVSTNQTIKSTDAGASAGPDLIIDRDSASAADADAIGRIIFRGNDDAGTPADNDYASIEASIIDSGAGSEDGKLDLKVCVAGTPTSYITAESTKGVKLQGATNGTAMTDSSFDGKVGEIISSAISAVTTAAISSGVSVAAVMAALTVPAGNWLLIGSSTGYVDPGPTGSGAASVGYDIYDTAGTSITEVRFLGVTSNAGATSDAQNVGINGIGYYSFTGSDKTIQFRIRCDQAGSSADGAKSNSRAYGIFMAIRIA
jgi:hypothetical protein